MTSIDQANSTSTPSTEQSAGLKRTGSSSSDQIAVLAMLWRVWMWSSVLAAASAALSEIVTSGYLF